MLFRSNIAYHRYFTHKHFTVSKPIEWLFLWAGSVSGIGDPISYATTHIVHHKHSDTELDPHSPNIHGIWRVLFGGAFLYVKAKQDRNLVDALGRGTPADWLELHLYSARPTLGIGLLLVLNTIIFDWWGPVIWGIQMMWIPFWAAGVINGAAHWWGYRNYAVKDTSRNLIPWGIWIGGEELHNNHHGDGASAKFSRRWWEFDIGWMYIRILSALRLAQVR